MHLLWSGRLRTDLTTPLSSMHVFERASELGDQAQRGLAAAVRW
jgi:hypothetical protein